MAGKRGLIMGVANDRSIAWGIARAVAEQGGELAFTYQGEALGKRVLPLAQSIGVDFVVPCDVGDDGSVTGGATGYGSFDWVFLELLFVPETLRGKGVGSELLARVEAFAREHKMLGVWLDTFNFQARPFYERHGYAVFGTIDNHPSGGQRYFLQKRFDAANPSTRDKNDVP